MTSSQKKALNTKSGAEDEKMIMLMFHKKWSSILEL